MNFDDLNGYIILENWDHLLKQEKLNALNHRHFPIHMVKDADSLMNDTTTSNYLLRQPGLRGRYFSGGEDLRYKGQAPSDAMRGVLMSWVPVKAMHLFACRVLLRQDALSSQDFKTQSAKYHGSLSVL